MRRIGQFITDAGGWAVASVVAAFLWFGVGLWEHADERSVSAFVFVCLSVPLFWVGAFLAWLKKSRALDVLIGQPKLSLDIVPNEGHYVGKFDFWVRNHSDDAAVNVAVSDIRLRVPETVKLRYRIAEASLGRVADDDRPHWAVRFRRISTVPAREGKELVYRVNGVVGPLHGQDLAQALEACGEGLDFSCAMSIEFSGLGVSARRWKSRFELMYHTVGKDISVQYIDTIALDESAR